MPKNIMEKSIKNSIMDSKIKDGKQNNKNLIKIKI